MKQAFWFKHDENARNDEKILAVRAEFGWEGYAWYFALLEMMSEASDGQIHRVAMAGLSVGLGIPKDRLTAFIDFCVGVELLKEDNGSIYSGRMLSQKAQRQALSQSGRAGAESRWKSKQEKASVSHENGQAMATPMQRRGEEKREEQTTGGKLRDEITKHLSREECEIDNPAAYLSKLERETSWPAIERAWKDWRRSVGITNPGQFYARAKHYHNPKSSHSKPLESSDQAA